MVSTLLSLQNGYQCRFYFQRECKTGCKVTKKAVKEKHPMAQATPESDFCAVVFCLCQSAIRLCMRRLSNIFVSFCFLTLILNFYNIIAFYASEKYLFGNKLFAFAEFGKLSGEKARGGEVLISPSPFFIITMALRLLIKCLVPSLPSPPS